MRTPAIPPDENAITAFLTPALEAQRAFQAADANVRSKVTGQASRTGAAVLPSASNIRLRMSVRSMNMIWLRSETSRCSASQSRPDSVISPPGRADLRCK